MDLVNRLIAWAACVTGAIIIGSSAFFAFHYYRQSGSTMEKAVREPVEADGTALDPVSGMLLATPNVPVEQLYLQQAQIRRLQALLDQKTKLLEQRTALLEQRNVEQGVLRTELEEAIEMLDVLAAELATAETTEGGQRNGEKLQNELERLRSESAKSRELSQLQQLELERLHNELGATDVDIAQLRQQAEQEFGALLADRQAFEAVVADTLVRVGAEAVPVLVYQLAHRRPDVRKWAAAMLGELGPLAAEAVLPLQDALKDQDPEVAEAARTALAKIDLPHR